MGKSPSPLHMTAGLRAYVSRQIEILRAQTPRALEQLAGEAVHDARVATRRLRAALAVLAPVLPKQPGRRLNRAGRTIRRTLGPLRDADVMIGHLEELAVPGGLDAPRRWLITRLADEQAARKQEVLGAADAEELLEAFDDWPTLAVQIDAISSAVPALLADAIHHQLDAFVRDAAAIVDAPAGPKTLDPHELRIDGKSLRYGIELAIAAGVRLPANLPRRMKTLQDALGIWHDHVVLGDAGLRLVQEHRLGYFDPELLRQVLKLVGWLTIRGDRHLFDFARRWKRLGGGIEQTLRKAFPVVRDVAGAPARLPQSSGGASGPRTDLDPSETPEPPASAAAAGASPTGG
jgi:CHAD domain-containing protein